MKDASPFLQYVNVIPQKQVAVEIFKMQRRCHNEKRITRAEKEKILNEHKRQNSQQGKD